MHLYKAPAEDVNKETIIEDIKMTEEIISCDICSTKVENYEFVIYKQKRLKSQHILTYKMCQMWSGKK